MKHSEFTPDNIQTLPAGSIFVFGSNEGGRHGAGAALTALKRFGAVYGRPEGLHGESYAIPTVDKEIHNKLPVDRIQDYVNTFIAFAKGHPDLIFYVTEIGCGLAGHFISDIAPLFRQATALPNVILPLKFYDHI
jgi:hypothetical protein